MSSPTFEQLRDAAVSRYLQTALVVDDELESGGFRGKIEVEELSGRPGIPAETEDEEGKSRPPAGEKQLVDLTGDDGRVDVKELADRFADLGVTCGILRPESEATETVVDRVVKAGRRADILVLDWRLDRESGDTALEVIARLVRVREAGPRLIAIYTTYRELRKVLERLDRELDGAETVPDDEFSLDIRGTRITIFNKPGAKLEPEDRGRVKGTRELPRAVIDAFALSVAGLVPSVALNALAATRANTHRLLQQLDASLDLGYIGHLLRIAHTEDGAQQLIDSVGQELMAVVADDRAVRQVAGRTGVVAWLEYHRDDLQRTVHCMSELLDVDFEDKKSLGDFKHRFFDAKKNEDALTSQLLPKGREADARLSDAAFAALTSLRRLYGRPPAVLQLGAIVREKGTRNRYWLCLQPVCDGERLSGPTPFPMLPLERVEHDARGTRFHLVVHDLGQPVHLWRSIKPSELRMMEFEPNEDRRVVFGAPRQDQTPRIEAMGGPVLFWVAQLKEAQAQRIVALLAHEFGRVGLDESEWLRRRADDGKRPKRTKR